MQTVFHNFHEMPNPLFREIQKIRKIYIINFSSAEFAHKMVKVKEANKCPVYIHRYFVKQMHKQQNFGRNSMD